jgi:D-alanyl-D-alanine carboxypeptidase
MAPSSGQLSLALDLQPLLDKVVAAGAPGILVRVQTPTNTLSLASGVADRSTSTRMTPELHFRTGSVTKTFVATVILQLVGEGRLHLDDPVATWLPGLLPHGDVITVRQILNHTSGLYNYTDDPTFQLMAFLGKTFEPRELVLIATLHPPIFAPGADWGYCNTNYVVAGLIIEKVTGHSLDDQLRTRIFQYLDLCHTTYPTTVDMPVSHARGYYFVDSLGYVEVTRTFHPSAFWGCGAIISNAADLLKFYQALLDGTLLSADLLKEMKTTAVNAQGEDTGFGLGLMRFPTSCGCMWGHGSDAPGYHTQMACSSPDGTRSAVATINSFEFPQPVVEPLNDAAAVIMCHALLDHTPTVVEPAKWEHVVPLLDDWSGLAQIIEQAHATLDRHQPDTMEAASP